MLEKHTSQAATPTRPHQRGEVAVRPRRSTSGVECADRNRSPITKELGDNDDVLEPCRNDQSFALSRLGHGNCVDERSAWPGHGVSVLRHDHAPQERLAGRSVEKTTLLDNHLIASCIAPAHATVLAGCATDATQPPVFPSPMPRGALRGKAVSRHIRRVAPSGAHAGRM